MELFLGNKNDIGVEVKVGIRNEHGTLMGYARPWFGGQFLGTFFDYIYLDGYLLGGFLEMLKIRILADLEFPSEPESQFHYFTNKANDLNDVDIDYYRVSFGTLTDNFIIWVYRKENSITILWKIEVKKGESCHEDLIDYPSRIFSHQMEYAEFKDFVERLDRILSIW